MGFMFSAVGVTSLISSLKGAMFSVTTGKRVTVRRLPVRACRAIPFAKAYVPVHLLTCRQPRTAQLLRHRLPYPLGFQIYRRNSLFMFVLFLWSLSQDADAKLKRSTISALSCSRSTEMFKVARNEVENASFAPRSAHRDSRIWRPELIEPAAEHKRRARGRRPTFKSAYPDPQILPQCNISSNYPHNVWFF